MMVMPSQVATATATLKQYADRWPAPTVERRWFGLIKRPRHLSTQEMISSGRLTPQEADEIEIAKWILIGDAMQRCRF